MNVNDFADGNENSHHYDNPNGDKTNIHVNKSIEKSASHEFERSDLPQQRRALGTGAVCIPGVLLQIYQGSESKRSDSNESPLFPLVCMSSFDCWFHIQVIDEKM